MSTEEVRLNSQGRVLFKAAYDAEHFQLALGTQAVAALYLDSTCTHVHYLVESLHC